MLIWIKNTALFIANLRIYNLRNGTPRKLWISDLRSNNYKFAELQFADLQLADWHIFLYFIYGSVRQEKGKLKEKHLSHEKTSFYFLFHARKTQLFS